MKEIGYLQWIIAFLKLTESTSLVILKTTILSSHSISSTFLSLNNMELNSPFVKGTST